MPGPVQHLATLVVKTDATGDTTAGLNTDRPAGHVNAWPGGVTDPSTNNEADGPGLIRNQFYESGTLLPRVVRDGGSGRPQYRVSFAGHICRQFVVDPLYSETLSDFTICWHEGFPLDFSARAGRGGDIPGGSLIAPGPDVPTLAAVNAIYNTYIGLDVSPWASSSDSPDT